MPETVFLNAPRWGLPFGVPYLENVLADRLPAWAASIDCRHAAQFERPTDCRVRQIHQCECGNPISVAGRYKAILCMECRNRIKCRENYRTKVSPTRYSRLKSPWGGE